MKRYEKPKCTHAFILHSFPMIKSLPMVSILYPFSPLMNFQIYTWDSLSFKPISYLTMVCYHQNPIGRTLGLTISPFFMMTNLSYLREKEISPSNQSWINQFEIYELTCEFSIGNKVNHENSISYIYSKVKCTRDINIWNKYDNDMHVGVLDPKYLSPFGNIKKKRRGSRWNQGWGGEGGNTEWR